MIDPFLFVRVRITLLCCYLSWSLILGGMPGDFYLSWWTKYCEIYTELASCCHKWGTSSTAILGWVSVWRDAAWLSGLVVVYFCFEVVPSCVQLGLNSLLIYCQKLSILSETILSLFLCSRVCPACFIHRKVKLRKLRVSKQDATARRSVSQWEHGSGIF